MDRYIIKGGKKLSGTITVSGSKNAALAIIPAAILAPGKHILRNVPNLRDIRTINKVLNVLGAETEHKDSVLTIDTTTINNIKAPYELVKTMRASIYVLGPLLARFKKAEVSLPGGCAIGQRPINLHLEGLEKMGAKIEVNHGFVIAEAKNLHGAEIIFEKVSVGATVNLMMAAALADGETILRNAAMEPEVSDLANCLNTMGGKVTGIGTDVLRIEGVKELKPFEYNVIPDRIEAGTFIVAGAITGSDITIRELDVKHVEALVHKMKDMGFEFTQPNNRVLTMKTPDSFDAAYIKTMPYPGFATDLQPLMMALMTTAKGHSLIHETIFENRYTQVGELVRMGADIEIDGNYAVIRGVEKLSGAPLIASDLRCGAALICAGLAAKGTTIVDRIYHIDRGYENIDEKFNAIGADIQRESAN